MYSYQSVRRQEGHWSRLSNCVCVFGVFVINVKRGCCLETQMTEIQIQDLIWVKAYGCFFHLRLFPLVTACGRIFHMRAYPHLSWTLSFSTDACRSFAMVCVLCRMSLSFCSCSRVSANSPCTPCSCLSRIWTCWTQLSRSASQRWSFSSRSATASGEKETKNK